MGRRSACSVVRCQVGAAPGRSQGKAGPAQSRCQPPIAEAAFSSNAVVAPAMSAVLIFSS